MTAVVLTLHVLQVRRFIMSPIRDPHLELVIVIFIVPFVVNVSIWITIWVGG